MSLGIEFFTIFEKLRLIKIQLFMKNIYKISMLLLSISAFPSNGEKLKGYSEPEIHGKIVPPTTILVNEYHPVSLSGFNRDVIAEGTGGDADEKTDSTIDFSNVLYSTDFVPATAYGSYESAEDYGGGLPATAIINSLANDDVSFYLAHYDGANALLLRPLISNTGTLTFQTTYAASSVYILWTGTEGQASAKVTVNFTDGTTQVSNNQVAYDWVSGSSGIAIDDLARVGNGSTMWAENNQFSESGAVKLFQKEIAIQTANQEKEISGVTFDFTGTGDYHSLAVFAITVFGADLGTNENAMAALSVYPNPTNGNVHVDSAADVKELNVVNQLGQVVASKKASADISISGLDSGIYFLNVTVEGNITKTQRIVKR